MNPADFASAPRPFLADLKGCEDWLACAALADGSRACTSFTELLDDLEDAPPSGLAWFQILERLRGPMHEAISEQARRFAGRPLPLSAAEDAAFMQVHDLWLALLHSWQALHRAADARASELAHLRPLLALRELECAAGLVYAHFDARRDVAPGLWRWVHQAYAWAERHHFAEKELRGDAGEPVTCVACYSELLLVHLADPWELSQRELACARRWAHRWAAKLRLWRSAENGGGLAVNFEGDAPPRWTPAGVPGAGVRFVDCAEVARSIGWRLSKLAEGTQPAEVGLEGDCTSASAAELLGRLARRWSDSQPQREAERRDCGSRIEVAAGFSSCYEAIAGRPFGSANPGHIFSRQAAEQIQVFQRAIDARPAQPVRIESCELLDESSEGFNVARGVAGYRISRGQLMAVASPGGRGWQLCSVQWLRQFEGERVAMGLRLLGGTPTPCAVRPSAQGGATHSWSPGLLIAGERPALVAPSGVLRDTTGAEISVSDCSRSFRVAVRSRGLDFDLVEAPAT